MLLFNVFFSRLVNSICCLCKLIKPSTLFCKQKVINYLAHLIYKIYKKRVEYNLEIMLFSGYGPSDCVIL